MLKNCSDINFIIGYDHTFRFIEEGKTASLECGISLTKLIQLSLQSIIHFSFHFSKFYYFKWNYRRRQHFPTQKAAHVHHSFYQLKTWMEFNASKCIELTTMVILYSATRTSIFLITLNIWLLFFFLCVSNNRTFDRETSPFRIGHLFWCEHMNVFWIVENEKLKPFQINNNRKNRNINPQQRKY